VNHSGQGRVCRSDRDHGGALVSDGDARALQWCRYDRRFRQLAEEECVRDPHPPGATCASTALMDPASATGLAFGYAARTAGRPSIWSACG
jgi:hypothetical protein